MTARGGQDPGELYGALAERLGAPECRRVEVAATPGERAALGRLSPEAVTATKLAGDPIREVLSTAPGNGAPIGGVKVIAEHGWFAARPSGTEDVYKVYAESLLGADHLERILTDAERLVQDALADD
jgi:phosphoglucomutase